MPEPLTGFQDIVFHVERGDLVDFPEQSKPSRYGGQRLSRTLHRITDPTREQVVVADGEPATVVLDPLLRCSTRILSTTVWSSVRSGRPFQTLIASLLHKYATGRLEDA
jgi:hypothetical protein